MEYRSTVRLTINFTLTADVELVFGENVFAACGVFKTSKILE